MIVFSKKYVNTSKIKIGKLTEIIKSYKIRGLRYHDLFCNEYNDVDGRYAEQRPTLCCGGWGNAVSSCGFNLWIEKSSAMHGRISIELEKNICEKVL